MSAALESALDQSERLTRSKSETPSFLKQLGLALPVTPDDVKQAFRGKAMAAHPDHGGDAQQFMQVQEAFDEAIEFAERNGRRLPWIGVQMPIYVAQRDIVTKVEAWGGQSKIVSLDWLDKTLGQDFAAVADRLVEIDLSNCPIGDEQLREITEQLEDLPFLECLRLAGTQVTDAGVAAISRAGNLRRLDLRETKVTNGRLRQLSKLPRMEKVEGRRGWFEWFS